MSQDLSTWQEIALIASPAIAAIAALASWASVWQARGISRAADRPELMIQKTIDASTNTIGATVTNGGNGAARGAIIYLSSPPYYACGALGHGFMFPGDTRHVMTEIPSGAGVDTDVMVVCRDKRSVPHYWSANEDHSESKDWRGRPQYRKEMAAAFREFHPAVDLDQLTQVEMEVTDLT